MQWTPKTILRFLFQGAQLPQSQGIFNLGSLMDMHHMTLYYLMASKFWHSFRFWVDWYPICINYKFSGNLWFSGIFWLTKCATKSEVDCKYSRTHSRYHSSLFSTHSNLSMTHSRYHSSLFLTTVSILGPTVGTTVAYFQPTVALLWPTVGTTVAYSWPQ